MPSPSEPEPHFLEALKHWKLTDSSADFGNVARSLCFPLASCTFFSHLELTPLSLTLPLIFHHREDILRILLEALAIKGTLAYSAVLGSGLL